MSFKAKYLCGHKSFFDNDIVAKVSNSPNIGSKVLTGGSYPLHVRLNRVFDETLRAEAKHGQKPHLIKAAGAHVTRLFYGSEKSEKIRRI